MKYAAPPDNILSDDDVAMFWGAMDHWQAKLGLQDWRITQSMRPPAGAMAMMDKWDWAQRQVRCRLNRNWKGEKPTPDTISQTALHELLHVLLHPLIESARDARSMPEDVAAAEHAVINTLERMLTE
jgi:hypothetical protein